jgi:hypothetical protein
MAMAIHTSGPTDGKGTPSGGTPSSEHVSTIEILHQHTIGATKSEKIVMPLVLLLVGAILAGILYIAWDHKSRDYTVAATVGDVLKIAARPLAQPTGLKKLLNPSDDQYVAFTVKSWQYWAGKGAIAQSHYIHIPGLQTESMEALVKGDRGAASITFRLDLSLSKSPDFHVIEIVRGGVAVPEKTDNLQIYPLKTVAKPGVNADGAEGAYRESYTFTWEREDTFRGAGRFTALGRLQKGEEGLWIQSKTFNVALSPEMEPGLAELLNEITNTRQSENVTFFLDLRDRALAAERQKSHTIGLAHLDGVNFGKFYVADEP